MKPDLQDIRFATANVNVVVDGVPTFVRVGTVWHVSNPVVVAHPDLFSDDARWAMNGKVDLDEDLVEQATANPGERRAVRRG